MSKQTINIGASPNDGTGTPLRTSFDYTNQNFTELYTALGGGVGLPGATTQVIFNDGGTNLAGDAGLVYNKTTDALTVAGLVTAGSATITGDLTVRTNKLKVDATGVGIGTASPTSGTLTVQTHYLLFPDSQTKIGDNGFCNGAASDGNTQIQFFGGKSLFFNEGASNTKMTLNSTGLGIGTAPANVITARAAQDTGLELNSAASNASRLIFAYDPANTRWYINSTLSGSGTTLPLAFLIGNTERMRIDTSGNVGIGLTPSAWTNQFIAIEGGDSNSQSAVSFQTNANAINLHSNSYYSTGYKYKFTGTAGQYALGGNQHEWYIAPSGTAGDAITFTQAMTLDASGRLLVGQTSTGLLNLNGIDIEGGDSNGGSYIIINHKLLTAAGQQYAFFAYSGVKTGDITQNGTTGVLYNTVSDYRLKESVKPISNGLARVNSLKPSSYNWKSDGSVGEGFIAHELAEAVPAAVSGEKDALNADGSINAQSVDMSRIIPILVAAIQELTTRVQTLEAR